MFCEIYRGKGKSNNKKYDFKESYDGRSHHPHLCNNRNYFISILGDELQYRDYFTQEDIDKLREAYNKSHDIRKFEIELYWKRATYFWTLTAALITFLGLTTTAYFSKSLESEKLKILIVVFIVSLLGYFLTIIMSLNAKSGKYWQNNWEFHVNKLELLFSGNLHKTHIPEPQKKRFSISKLNDASYMVILIFWSIAIEFSAFQMSEDYFFISVSTIIIIAIFFYIYIYFAASPDNNSLRNR
ncbi:hypothetical protein BV923_00730 [Pectobacterium odoriferum]|uniref:RipA family octameric membrane protein n=1 Tax=Pectobacterium odoriferum TaxID=78398 RepID=UPI000CD26C85|nr:hypothetical protein [Pectobacterium odoriferum]POE24982.1 hypothetical protein BV923_00730 [Pectobacterium odoriferum]